VTAVFDTLRPALVHRYPPHRRSSVFNVQKAAAELREKTGRKDPRAELYRLIRGERVSMPFLRDLCALLDVDVPSQQPKPTKAELEEMVSELGRALARSREELEQARRQLAKQATLQRQPQELPKPGSQRRGGGRS